MNADAVILAGCLSALVMITLQNHTLKSTAPSEAGADAVNKILGKIPDHFLLNELCATFDLNEA